MKKSAGALNIMEVAGQKAAISYVPEIGMFRGKFLGLSGYCDFIADSIAGLKQEGEISLRGYLDECRDNGIDPYQRVEKHKTFTLRYPELLEGQLKAAAAHCNESLNTFIIEAVKEKLQDI